MSEEKLRLKMKGTIEGTFELTEDSARLLAGICSGRVRTFRHPDGKYGHTVSAVDPNLKEWPEELEADEVQNDQDHQ